MKDFNNGSDLVGYNAFYRNIEPQGTTEIDPSVTERPKTFPPFDVPDISFPNDPGLTPNVTEPSTSADPILDYIKTMPSHEAPSFPNDPGLTPNVTNTYPNNPFISPDIFGRPDFQIPSHDIDPGFMRTNTQPEFPIPSYNTDPGFNPDEPIEPRIIFPTNRFDDPIPGTHTLPYMYPETSMPGIDQIPSATSPTPTVSIPLIIDGVDPITGRPGHWHFHPDPVPGDKYIPWEGVIYYGNEGVLKESDVKDTLDSITSLSSNINRTMALDSDNTAVTESLNQALSEQQGKWLGYVQDCGKDVMRSYQTAYVAEKNSDLTVDALSRMCGESQSGLNVEQSTKFANMNIVRAEFPVGSNRSSSVKASREIPNVEVDLTNTFGDDDLTK